MFILTDLHSNFKEMYNTNVLLILINLNRHHICCDLQQLIISAHPSVWLRKIGYLFCLFKFILNIIHLYIYIYAFSRCFFPKRLTVHSGYTFVLSVFVFPANRTHNLCVLTEPQEHFTIQSLYGKVDLTNMLSFECFDSNCFWMSCLRLPQ